MEQHLTERQIFDAYNWFENHKSHVFNIISNCKKYPPSDLEDKNNPNLWKPEHWKWFMGYYTFLCDSCGTESGVKLRIHNEKDYGMFCNRCWNIVKKDIGKVYKCSDCGSDKAKPRVISTGIGKKEVLEDILCDSCFVDMFYEFSN